MTNKHFLVTGGTGFIGAALVMRLLKQGHRIRVFDNNSRGAQRRLGEALGEVELVVGDIRDPDAVRAATKGVDAVHHLAYVNGTENFYNHPDLVLEVGAKGIINVVDSCIANEVAELILASSSEVYQYPPSIPTDETAPLIVPDLMNPRYSYGGGKLFSELYAINVAARRLGRVVIYRPHNIYGPDMGWEHVIPQFAVRLKRLVDEGADHEVPFQIQGSGDETRSFCYIDDFIDGVVAVQDRGLHQNVYHIGTTEEVAIADLARRIASLLGREIRLVGGLLLPGSTARRCPAIDKIQALGYRQRTSLDSGLLPTCRWYFENLELGIRS